jgi:hypothetical protein
VAETGLRRTPGKRVGVKASQVQILSSPPANIMIGVGFSLLPIIFKKNSFAVLDGEVAVPCNSQSAIVGLNSYWRVCPCGASLK